MAEIVFTADEYNNVRALLDSRMTSDELKDSNINSEVFIGAAEREVDGEIWDDISTKDISVFNERTLLAYRRAIIYRTTSRITISTPQMLSESAGSITQQFEQIDWKAIRQQLYEYGTEEIEFVRNTIFPTQETDSTYFVIV